MAERSIFAVLLVVGLFMVLIFVSSPGDNPVKTTIKTISNTFFIEDGEQGVSVWAGEAQMIPSGQYTWVNWSEEEYDDSGMFNAVSDGGNVTIQVTGDYLVSCSINFEGHNNGIRGVAIMVNGTFAKAITVHPSDISNATASISGTFRFVQGTKVGINAYQSAAVDLELTSTQSMTFLSVIQQ